MPISGPALREPPAASSISEEATDDVSWWRELPGSVQDVYRYRELLYELTLRDLRIRYKQAVMGLLWAIIVPVVVVLAGALFRYAWAGSSGQDVSRAELAGLAIKSLAWSFFVGAMSFATPSLTANLPLVTKVYFPRELLPLSAVLTQVVDSSIGVLALLILLPATGIGSLAGLAWLPLIVTLLVAVTWRPPSSPAVPTCSSATPSTSPSSSPDSGSSSRPCSTTLPPSARGVCGS